MSPLDALVNRLLALDPELPGKLDAFDGKVIALHVESLAQTVYLQVEAQRLRILKSFDGEADVILSGSLPALLKMAGQRDVAGMMLEGEIRIRGNTRLGHAFKALLAGMRPDWQQPLSRLIGDGATQMLEDGLRHGWRWLRQSHRAVLADTGEYLAEESRQVVAADELEGFNLAVDELRDDVERLALRIDALRAAPRGETAC